MFMCFGAVNDGGKPRIVCSADGGIKNDNQLKQKL